MKKIVIIGYSGSGKSSLGRFLAGHYQIPVLHLDEIHFTHQWQERPNEDMREDLLSFIKSHDSWVIEGNYRRILYQERLELADQIIFMNFGPLTCLYRVTKRFFKYRGQTRPDMGPACLEKLDWDFIDWVLRRGRTARIRDDYQAVQTDYQDKVQVLNNQKDLDHFLAQVLQSS